MFKLTTAIAMLSLAAAACGDKKKVQAPTEPVSSATQTKTPVAQDDSNVKVVEAKGDMREILLALERVHFAFDSDELTKSSRDALDEAATKLSENPQVALFVEGHTDERGTAEYNIALAERRAKVVTTYLQRLGVDKNRLHPKTYGEEKPLAQGNDMKAHALNRRVDFRLMKGNVRFVLKKGRDLALGDE